MSGIDWGPGWIVLEDGRGIHRGDARPCSFGGPIKVVSRRRLIGPDGNPAAIISQVACPKCVKPRPGEVVIGWIDTRTWEYHEGAPKRIRR